MPRTLTKKQQRFVEYYVGEANGNGTKAARLAGYSGDEVATAVAASRLKRDPKIKEAIDKELANSAAKSSITPGRIITLLIDFAENIEISMTHRLRSLENLIRIFGMATQKVEVESNVKLEQTRVEIRNYLADKSVAQSIQKLESKMLEGLPPPPVEDVDEVVNKVTDA